MKFEFEKKRLYGLLGKDLVETLKNYKCFVAGGAITSLFCNRNIKDYDVYFRSKEEFIAFIYDTWDNGNWIITSTDKATAIMMDNREVQVIHFKFFESVEEIFDTFDFTVCMGAFDFKTEEFVLHDDFLRHNSQRVIKFNTNTAFPIVSLLRLAKYQAKGYTNSKTELVKIIMTCMKLSESITTWDELKEQLGGMYGVNYDKMFEDVEDEEFDFTKAIEYVSELTYEDAYYEENEPMQYNSVEELLLNIVDDINFKYFELNDDHFLVLPNGDFEYLDNPLEKAEEITAEEYFKDKKLYKFVHKTEDGKYRSFYDKNFYYRIGAEVIPVNEYLFFNIIQDLKSSSFYNRPNGVCIEVEVDPKDISSIGTYNEEIRVKKGRVIREVPEEEWRARMKNSDYGLPF